MVVAAPEGVASITPKACQFVGQRIIVFLLLGTQRFRGVNPESRVARGQSHLRTDQHGTVHFVAVETHRCSVHFCSNRQPHPSGTSHLDAVWTGDVFDN